MTTSRFRPLPLALATVALAALPLPAFANTGWAFLYLGALSLVVVLVTLAIETPLVRWGTGAGWWPALGATVFANLVSFIFGLLTDLELLGDPERLRTAVMLMTSGPDAAGGAIVVVIALSVVLGAAIELAILWLIFGGRLRPAPAAIIFAVNVLLSGIGGASSFTPEDYEKVSEAEAARVESYYAPEIRFMRDTLADLPGLWSDESIVVVDGNFVYPGFEDWLKERQARLAGLRFVSLTISGFTPRDRPSASITSVPRDLVPPIVEPWEGQGARIDRAARRYVTKPRPGPAEPLETYRYTIRESGFTITALFDPPP